jgi:hypothetical protein
MKKFASLFAKLRKREDGVTIVEFGLVSFPLLMMIFGAMDLGYNLYLRAQIQGALDAASREATVGGLTPVAMDLLIQNEIRPLLLPGATFTVTRRSYDNFSAVGRPEPLTSDTNSNGAPDVGDCYQDTNNNNAYDTDRGVGGGGGADDIVYYEINVGTPRLFPLAAPFGYTENYQTRATALFKNQPFGAQDLTVTTRCIV